MLNLGTWSGVQGTGEVEEDITALHPHLYNSSKLGLVTLQQAKMLLGSTIGS
jgi:hypothetical protein